MSNPFDNEIIEKTREFSTQQQALTVFSGYHFVDELEEKYVATGGAIDFPLMQDPRVEKAIGMKGKSFASQIAQRMFWDAQNLRLLGVEHFPFNVEGPPGKVHGGALATVLDRVLGWFTVRMVGYGCMTAFLKVDYRKPVPLGSVVRFVCELDAEAGGIQGRKVYCKGRLADIDDPEEVFTEAHALFFKASAALPDFKTAKAQLASVTPEMFLAALERRRIAAKRKLEDQQQTDSKSKL